MKKNEKTYLAKLECFGEDIIDTRDLIEQFEELKEGDETGCTKEIEEIIDELKDYCPDFEHGETLIHERYLDTYFEEMLDERGTLPKDLPGFIVINWERTVKNLLIDYGKILIDGKHYYYRNV